MGEFEMQKRQISKILCDLKQETETLLQRVIKVEHLLGTVATQEDLDKFVQENDIEDGLEMIQLFLKGEKNGDK